MSCGLQFQFLNALALGVAWPPVAPSPGLKTPLLPWYSFEYQGYYQDPLRSVESNTQIHLNLSTDLEPPCQARSNGLLGTT
jgi:hypothetical protein